MLEGEISSSIIQLQPGDFLTVFVSMPFLSSTTLPSLILRCINVGEQDIESSEKKKWKEARKLSTQGKD